MMITRMEEIVHTVLSHQGGPVGRTRLVKLLFLADVEAVRSGMDPITSRVWKHFHFGPHIWAPTDAADALATEGYLTRHPWESGTGHEGVDYRCTDQRPTYHHLELRELELLRAVVVENQGRSLEQIKTQVYAMPIVSSTPKEGDIDLLDLARRPWFYEAMKVLHERFDDELRELAQ